MRYIYKIVNKIEKNGIMNTISYCYKRIKIMIGNQVFWNKNKSIIKNAVKSKNVIIITKTIEWNYAFQRTQQLATQFSKMEGYCVIYVTEPTCKYDYFINIDKINDNLLCFSYKHYKLLDILLKDSKSKILYITNLLNYANDIKIQYDIMVYEYIDELSLWFKDKMDEGIQKHNKAIKDANLVVVTASKLYDEVSKKTDKVVLCENAGDYDFFSKIETFESDYELDKIASQFECILGYYGMLADWFDFDLVKKIAERNPKWAWVLVGPTYPDYDLSKNNLENYNNIFVLGSKPYNELPRYVKKMDILTIPFKLNEITASTSPVKLFEYMATQKGIITSNMVECRKYKSVYIYNSLEEFEKIICKIKSMPDKEKEIYAKLLLNEAKENTWEKRAKLIMDSL